MRVAWAIFGAALWACSSSGQDGPRDAGATDDAAVGADATAGDAAVGPGQDAGPDDRSDPLDPVTPIVGMVSLEESTIRVGVTVIFMDAPWIPVALELVAEEGDCAYYEPATPELCDPPCAETEGCMIDGVCRPYPQRVSAGRVTIEAPDWTATADHEETNWYTVEGAPVDDLFDPEDTIVVSAPGDQVEPFTVRLRGVGTMQPDPRVLDLQDGEDNVIPFTPQGDGARIELILQTGWHGAPPEAAIWCHGDDAAGQIRVPRALVERFPSAGGVGLLPHPSILRRVRRRLVESPFGLIEVSLSSSLDLALRH